MRFHLLFSLPINLGPPKKIMEIRGGGGGHLWAWKFRQEGESN